MRLLPLLVLATLLAGCLSWQSSQDDHELGAIRCLVCDQVLPNDVPVWEPSGAASPIDPLHYAVAYRADAPTIEVHIARDGGYSWTRSLVPIGDDADAGSQASSWTYTGDAVVFFDAAGTLYVGGLGFAYDAGATGMRGGASIFVAKSLDGLTLETPIVVAHGGGFRTNSGGYGHFYKNQDRPWFAAGADGRMVAAWNELGHDGPYVAGVTPYDGNVFQTAISVDGGATWNEPVTHGHSGWPGALVTDEFVVAHSSHQSGVLSIGTSSDGKRWDWEEVGTLLGQPDLAWQGGLLVAGTSSWQGGLAPSYWRQDAGEWKGPFIFGEAQEDDPFTNIASSHDGSLWVSWYDATAPAYRFAQLADPHSPWPTQRLVAGQGFEARTSLYGDYVDTLAVTDRVYVVWNAQHGDERSMHVSVYGP